MGVQMATQLLTEDYLTDPQIAEQLNRSLRTVQRLRRQGVLPPAIVVGSQRFTHRDVLAEHLRAREPQQANH